VLRRSGYIDGLDIEDDALFDVLSAYIRTENFEEHEQQRGYLNLAVLEYMKGRREGADPALARRPLLRYPTVRTDRTPPGERGVARGDARCEQPKDALQDPLPISYRNLRPRRTHVA
jgi:Putative peptidoglycan binding domain